jgi:RNA polymerase sigma-70 factor (ECF subfamily)
VVSLAGAEGQIAAEEARLIAQIAAGDTGPPVAELYRRHGRRLYRFGLELLGDGRRAEEMVQECFVRLCRDAGRFDVSRGTGGGYLFALARSSAADGGGRPEQADDADQILDSLVVHEALEALSPAHADVLRLAQDEGLTQSQIAARLGLPVGTVKARMFYGMQALLSALTERRALAGRGSHAV